MKAILLCCLVCLPLKKLQVNSGYGERIHPLTGRVVFHEGVDLQARLDTVYAVMDGIIESVTYQRQLGINLRLTHDRIHAVYGHLSAILVSREQQVHAGDPIAITGATGQVTGPHLHFALAYDGRCINPLQFLYQILTIKNHEHKTKTTLRPGR